MVFMIRDLEITDINADYMRLLCQLSGKEKEYKLQDSAEFWLRYKNNKDHQTFVYEDGGRIIGTATVLVEHKLLHYGSRVGHIEDVVINQDCRHSGIGKMLIEACLEFCRSNKCYKAILDCSKENIPFYEKCGFRFTENCMRIDLGDK
jgi:glucosamine-phosphate N-acetyltransferase